MRILARVLTTVLGSAVVFFVACTGGGTPAPEGQQPQDGSTPAEDTTPADRAAFSSQDLCNLIFAEDDTPLGLPIRRSESVEEEDECARLFFRDDQNVISRATLYEDSDEASAELQSQGEDLLDEEGFQEVEAPLGEEAYAAARPYESTGFVCGEVIYLWRVSNVVLELQHNDCGGKVDEAEVLALAEEMQAKAEQA